MALPDTAHLKTLSVRDLLQLQHHVLLELQSRGILRTKNNPLGDYAEWLVASRLGLELQTNSSAGCDAIGKDGTRYQIKARRLTPNNQSRMLGAIRNYEKRDFDRLIAIIFNEEYEILHAVMIPHELVGHYAKFKAHTNGHVLVLNGRVLKDEKIISIKDGLKI